MSTLLENFLNNFKDDWYTVPGSHIYCGYNRTHWYYPFSSKSLNNCFSIVWILTGKGHMTENRQTYGISDMSFCIGRPDREWEIAYYDEENIRLFFRLPEEVYLALAVCIPELTNLPPVKKVDYSDDLLREYLILQRKFKNISVTEFHTVWEDLVEYILNLTGISVARGSSSLERAKRMLEDTASPKTLEEIAEECCINYNSFRKQFSAVYDISPGKFRTLCKIEASKDALYSGASIKETAEKLGFSDVYSFTHCFKSVVGIPPAQYREQVIKDIPKKTAAASGGTTRVEYKIGTINAKDGLENPSLITRLHSQDYIPLAAAEGVTVKEGYQLSWLAYGKDRYYLGNGNNYKGMWQPDGAPIRCSDILALYPDAVYFRFVIKNSVWLNMGLLDVIRSGVTVVAAGGTLTDSSDKAAKTPHSAT